MNFFTFAQTGFKQKVIQKQESKRWRLIQFQWNLILLCDTVSNIYFPTYIMFKPHYDVLTYIILKNNEDSFLTWRYFYSIFNYFSINLSMIYIVYQDYFLLISPKNCHFLKPKNCLLYFRIPMGGLETFSLTIGSRKIFLEAKKMIV